MLGVYMVEEERLAVDRKCCENREHPLCNVDQFFSFNRVKDKLQESKPAESEVFQKNVQPFIKEVLNDFKEYQLFCGE